MGIVPCVTVHLTFLLCFQMIWALTSQQEYVHKALEITTEYTFVFLYAIVTESFSSKIFPDPSFLNYCLNVINSQISFVGDATRAYKNVFSQE